MDLFSNGEGLSSRPIAIPSIDSDEMGGGLMGIISLTAITAMHGEWMMESGRMERGEALGEWEG